MALCPAGHDSDADDYCDRCGTPMSATTPGPATTGLVCPKCRQPRDGRFCEACGHDSLRPADPEPASAGGWSVLVAADRSWFEEVRRRNGPDAATLEFPRYCPERTFALNGPQLAIGRRSRSRGITPEIDLSGPPADPGVSALHAVLLPRPDGGWELIDLGSTNGTVIGDATEPIAPNLAVALTPGDRIRIGAWTTLTITGATG